MKSVAVLERIRLENANAVAGQTYGFPAITAFLGATHALSRRLQQTLPDLSFTGCGVVAHDTQVKMHRSSPWSDAIFSLSRNPLTQDGGTAPFNERPKMHATLSLLIACDFDSDELEEALEEADIDFSSPEQWLTRWLNQAQASMRLAGGVMTSVQDISYHELKEEPEAQRKQCKNICRKLLPGFALLSAHDQLTTYHQTLKTNNESASLFDAWLRFSELHYSYQADPQDESNASWQRSPRPSSGYVVPIMAGYHGLSDVQEAGTVPNARDPECPFQLVEACYSLGEWRSPHRIQTLNDLMWHYQVSDSSYLCINPMTHA